MKMTLGSEEENFLVVAVAAIPRIAEIIASFPAEHREGALEVAERRYIEAARDFGCTEVAARTRVSEVMHNLRTQVDRQRIDQQNLQALLHKLTRLA
jgi:DNA-directed RNA polymerase specialized sigma24 family protein